LFDLFPRYISIFIYNKNIASNVIESTKASRMDKLSKDELLIDIEHLFHGSTITPNANYEISQALNRLEAILNLILNTTNKSNQSHYLFNQLKSLNDLNEFYEKLKLSTEATKPNEVKYVECLLIKRLNSLNAKLNLTDSNILFRNPQFNTANQIESLIGILNDYDYNENLTLVSCPRPTASKLTIKTIFLEDNLGEQLTNGSDYLCSVYQFQSNEFLIAEQVRTLCRSGSSNQQLRQPRSKSHSKGSMSSMSKRSSSADLNTLKHRRSKADIRGTKNAI